jgi:hypothetical protein
MDVAAGFVIAGYDVRGAVYTAGTQYEGQAVGKRR